MIIESITFDIRDEKEYEDVFGYDEIVCWAENNAFFYFSEAKKEIQRYIKGAEHSYIEAVTGLTFQEFCERLDPQNLYKSEEIAEIIPEVIFEMAFNAYESFYDPTDEEIQEAVEDAIEELAGEVKESYFLWVYLWDNIIKKKDIEPWKACCEVLENAEVKSSKVTLFYDTEKPFGRRLARYIWRKVSLDVRAIMPRDPVVFACSVELIGDKAKKALYSIIDEVLDELKDLKTMLIEKTIEKLKKQLKIKNNGYNRPDFDCIVRDDSFWAFCRETFLEGKYGKRCGESTCVIGQLPVTKGDKQC